MKNRLYNLAIVIAAALIIIGFATYMKHGDCYNSVQHKIALVLDKQNPTDVRVAQMMCILQANHKGLCKNPIALIEASNPGQLVPLLESHYADGARVFIGFANDQAKSSAEPFFAKHSDAKQIMV